MMSKKGCCRIMDIVGGQKWGSLVNKETNSFNGMIGMVQRKVYILSAWHNITTQIGHFHAGGRPSNGGNHSHPDT